MSSRTSWFCQPLIVALILSGCSPRFIHDCCRTANPVQLQPGKTHEFVVDYKSKCNASGVILMEKQRYSFTVEPLSKLEDGIVKCLPPDFAGKEQCKPIGLDGFKADSLSWFKRFVLWLSEGKRPCDGTDAGWLQLVGTVGHGNKEFFPLSRHVLDDHPYEAKETGEFYALANDYPWLERYRNNVGIVKITVKRVEK
jgi:hypothetical protein